MSETTKLSISSITLFKACRRAYELKKIYGVEPVKRAEALETGSSYHKMVENLHRTGEVPELSTKETAMAIAYARYIYPKMPKFEPEVWFEKPFGRGNIIVGRADGIVVDESAIVEHKTTSTDIDQYEYDLQWNEQLLTYFLATGVRKAYYTICRKPTIRQKQSESDYEFAQRCLDWYDEDTNSKIRMIKVSRTYEEVSQYKKSLSKMFSEIKRAKSRGNYYRNTCHCHAWGRQCEYAPICLHYDPEQEYVGFERRTYEDNKHSGQYF